MSNNLQRDYRQPSPECTSNTSWAEFFGFVELPQFEIVEKENFSFLKVKFLASSFALRWSRADRKNG